MVRVFKRLKYLIVVNLKNTFLSGLKLDKTEHDGGMFIKASRKLDHYVLKPTLEKLLNSGKGITIDIVTLRFAQYGIRL